MQQRWLLIVGLVLVVLGILGLLLRSKIRPAQAGILIETNPASIVYINGEQVGQTPYEDTRIPGEISLRLVPIANNGPLSTWETKLALTEGIKTVVRRDFGETLTKSSGDVLSFERVSGNQAALTIVSSPDAAQVTLDGQVKGFTPIRLESVSVGEHQIRVSQPGFTERSIFARAEPGYRLTVVATLAQTEEQLQEASPQAELEEVNLADYEVQVLNGSGVPGEAGRVKEVLTEKGFTAGKIDTGNAPTFDYTKTQVRLKENVSKRVFESIKEALSDYSVEKGQALEESFEFDVVVTVGTRQE